MPHGVVDSAELGKLLDALREIVAILDGWERKGAAQAPPIDVRDVRAAFQGIASALKESGEDGRGLREQLPSIARHLQAAAEALNKSTRR